MTSTRLPNGALAAELSIPSKDKNPRSLSRSPHPYHRRSSSLQTVQRPLGQIKTRYSESSDSTESEERATEADDEKGRLHLKSLPAPPLRGRKGLRGSRTTADSTPAISPFPTPPAVNDIRSSYFSGNKQRKGSRTDVGEQERNVEAYNKYLRRRRAEIARRGTEAVLLTSIGAISYANSTWKAGLLDIVHELYTALGLLVFLHFLFPVRIALQRFCNGSKFLAAVKVGFHIPSVFDPGALMYPVFLPSFISASIPESTSELMITNVILGLASLPHKVIPFSTFQPFNCMHWLLSIVPVITSGYSSGGVTLTELRARRIEAEIFVLLYPLHQSTLMTLKYLTSTSLDPAEIQLLSTGLINLFLFAVHPQAEILKALIWIGALCIFVTCQKPLSWEVKLARVPSWKFARNRSPRTGLLSVSEKILKIVLPKHRSMQTQNPGSEDEDYEHLKSARRMVKNQIRFRKTKLGGTQSELEATTDERDKDTGQINGSGLQRSLTVPGDGTYSSIRSRKRKYSVTPPNTGLLSLTYIQAQACKWLISGYVLSAVAFIILVIVRQYVSVQALSSHEPFGWAIGYLFGDIQPLRLWVVSNNLEGWIKIPSHRLYKLTFQNYGLVEQIRQIQLGPANTRLAIAGYCILTLTIGIGAVLRLGTVAEVDTRRKVFHGIMVAMLLPSIAVDPCFIALALSLILAIFLLLDLFRASQLPPISKPLTTFLAPYVDGRDHRGPVIVSPIFLLIGCAIPLWLSLAGSSRTGQYPWSSWDTDFRELSMTSGVVCVGMGDAAASLIGRRYGRTKWFWGGGKSLEGSLAFTMAVTVGLAASYTWLRIGGWMAWDRGAVPLDVLKMTVAGSGASLLESVLTAGNDNVIVPIGLWLLTRGLCI